MHTLRLASKTTLLAVLSLTLILTGCTNTQVQDSISVAAEVTTSAASIIAPVNPQLGVLLTSVGARLKDAGSLYSAYYAAAEADRPGLAGKLHATLGVISANLQTILNDARIKNPETVEYISVAVAVANTTVNLVLAHLPKTAPTRVMAASINSAGLPILKDARSAKDLAAAWNNVCGPNHPEAVVNAPKHKRLGIF